MNKDFEDAKAATEAMFSQAMLGDDGGEAGDAQAVGDDGGEAGDTPLGVGAQTQQPNEPTAQEQAQQSQQTPVQEQTQQSQQQPVQQQAQQSQQQPVQQPTQRELELQNELAQLRQQNEAYEQQNAQLQTLINQQSQVQEEAVEEAVMPTFDFTRAMYGDDDDRRRLSTDYANDMLKYVMGRVKGDMQPVIDEYNAAQRERQTREIVDTYKTVPEFSEMERLLPQMEYIIKQNPRMFNENIPLNEQLVMAYAAARGVNAPVGERKYTLDELMGLYDGNSEFRDAIEQRRVAAVKNGQQVPPAAASSGAANVALNIKDKPKNMSDAKAATLAMLGLN